MKRFFKIYSGVIVTLLLFIVAVTPVLVGAATQSGPGIGTQAIPQTGTQSGPGATPNQTNTYTGGGFAKLDNPLGSTTSFCKLVLDLLKAITIIGIPIAILFIVWAGFQFVLAQGKPDALATARRNFLNVCIGIGIFVGASLIANVIVNTLQQLGVQGISSC